MKILLFIILTFQYNFSLLNVPDGEPIRLNIDADPKTEELELNFDGKKFDISLARPKKDPLKSDIPEELIKGKYEDIVFNELIGNEVQQTVFNMGPALEKMDDRQKEKEINKVKTSLLVQHNVEPKEALNFAMRSDRNRPKFRKPDFVLQNKDFIEEFHDQIDDSEFDENFQELEKKMNNVEERVKWLHQQIINEASQSKIKEKDLLVVHTLLNIWKKFFQQIRLQDLQEEKDYSKLRKFLEIISYEVSKIDVDE